MINMQKLAQLSAEPGIWEVPQSALSVAGCLVPQLSPEYEELTLPLYPSRLWAFTESV